MEHGHYKTYVKKGCRCEPCTEANTKKIRAMRKRDKDAQEVRLPMIGMLPGAPRRWPPYSLE